MTYDIPSHKFTFLRKIGISRGKVHIPKYNGHLCMHMWQSRVEIKHYSVAYFDRITVFEAL